MSAIPLPTRATALRWDQGALLGLSERDRKTFPPHVLAPLPPLPPLQSHSPSAFCVKGPGPDRTCSMRKDGCGYFLFYSLAARFPQLLQCLLRRDEDSSSPAT